MVVILKNIKPYLLTGSLLLTTAIFSIVGNDWKHLLYEDDTAYSSENLPLNYVMNAIHDDLFVDGITAITNPKLIDTYAMESHDVLASDFHAAQSEIPPNMPKKAVHINKNINADSTVYKNCILDLAIRCNDIGNSDFPDENYLNQTYLHIDKQEQAQLETLPARFHKSDICITKVDLENVSQSFLVKKKKLKFTTVADNYFQDAVFIGDSRTVGIAQYADIPDATFLCKTSLTVYDYHKNVITYENKKTSIHDVLAQKQFKKVYFMVGINECGYGTNEDYAKTYREIIQDIRSLQPDALIYVQGNLFVTDHKSKSNSKITNERIQERNDIIQSLENKYDIFYLDINESDLCKDGALIPEYTWDEVHIKAQYYSIWKDFYLSHAIVP